MATEKLLPAGQMAESSKCWCGCEVLEPFSPDYSRCTRCQTLVIRNMPAADNLVPGDGESGFYGRDYYERYLPEHYGYPPITVRARQDLPERCAFWLQTLLKYRTPPASVLEIGCGHGGFVALLRAAGFDATGLEVNSWLVE